MILPAVAERPRVKGVIFDKDGTLFDFNATWGQWSGRMIAQETDGDAALAAKLAEVLRFDPLTNTFLPGSVVIAATNDEIADAFLSVIPGDRDALLDRMQTAAIDAPQVPATDLDAALTGLLDLGLVLGVATNDAEAAALAHLDQAGARGHFAAVYGYDSGFGGKPAPGQLHAFCAATGLAAADCVMVGDSLHDLHAGRAAGMMTVGVLTGPALKAELAPFADVVLPDIGALPAWLDS